MTNKTSPLQIFFFSGLALILSLSNPNQQNLKTSIFLEQLKNEIWGGKWQWLCLFLIYVYLFITCYPFSLISLIVGWYLFCMKLLSHLKFMELNLVLFRI